MPANDMNAVAIYLEIEQRCIDDQIEASLAELAEQVGSVAVLEGLARLLARAACCLGDAPEGGTYAYHALALHEAARRLSDDLARLRARHTGEWI